MEEAKLQTLAQIKAFLDGASEVTFRVSKEERNQFIERVFKRFGHASYGRVEKGVLLRYIERMTGLSRQQVTRLVRQYRKDGKLSKHPQRVAPKNGFTRRYTVADVAFLAEMDVLHNTHYPGLPPRSSWSVRFKYLVMCALSVWPTYRFLTCITYVGTSSTRTNDGIGPRQIQRESPSANAAPRNRMVSQATSVSTACIKATRMASKACITSTRWTV